MAFPGQTDPIFSLGAAHTTDLISFGNTSQWQPFPATQPAPTPQPVNPFMTSGGGFNPFATSSNPGIPVAAQPPRSPFAASNPGIPVAAPAITWDPAETKEFYERKIAELEAKLASLLTYLRTLEEENVRLKAQLASKDGAVSQARLEHERRLQEQRSQAEAAQRQIREHILNLKQKHEAEKRAEQEKIRQFTENIQQNLLLKERAMEQSADRKAEVELKRAAQIIADAAQSLKEQTAQASKDRLNPADWAAHDAIAQSAMRITHATQMLIDAAAAAQQERVARGIAALNAGEAYHEDPMWAEGLISAAKAVANSTMFLVKSANQALVGNVDEATLTACCKAVAAHTAKLQQATRVKSEHDSRAQAQLDVAAKLVKDSTNGLVDDTKKFSAFSESQIAVKPLGSGFNNIKAERELEATLARLKTDLERANARLFDSRKTVYESAREKQAYKLSSAASSDAQLPRKTYQKAEIDTTPIVSAFSPRGNYTKSDVDRTPASPPPKAEIDTTPIVSPFSGKATSKADFNSVPDNVDSDLPTYMKKKLQPVALTNEKYDILDKKPALEVAPRPLHLQHDLNAGFQPSFSNAPSEPNPFAPGAPSSASSANPFGASSSPFGTPAPAPAPASPFGTPSSQPFNPNPFGTNTLPPPANPPQANPFGAPLPPPSNAFSSNPWG